MPNLPRNEEDVVETFTQPGVIEDVSVAKASSKPQGRTVRFDDGAQEEPREAKRTIKFEDEPRFDDGLQEAPREAKRTIQFEDEPEETTRVTQSEVKRQFKLPAMKTGLPSEAAHKMFYHGRSFLEEDVPEESQVQEAVSLNRPQTHRLPTFVIWSITLATPVFVGAINYMIVVMEHSLMEGKFKLMQEAFNNGGVAPGALVLASISALLAAVATCLVTWIGPLCAGSGLPEAKGYLNGNIIPDLFTMKNLAVRIFGITLACAAGYPVGREGPMVCIGGTIGYQVVDKVAIRWVRRWVNVHTKQGVMNPALIVDEERFAHAKRIGCALGGAAGIATAFNAPIGGILYMFEEVTVTSWSPELTFRAFVVTVLAAMFARGLLNLTHGDVHRLVIFDATKASEETGWNWEDVPFFLMLSIFVGLCSAFFARAMLAVWNARDKFKKSKRCKDWKKVLKAIEAIAFAFICALAFALLPLLIECVQEPHASAKNSSGRHLSGGAGLSFVRHNCNEGEHREVATLLLTGPEQAVKHLFSRHQDSNMRLGPLLLATGVYSVLACGMPGLPVPMGAFVPCLVIGGLIGRFVGEIANETSWASMVAHPGVYALVGSAAMLSGFTHMTIAILVLLIEAAADLSLVSPIMLGIFVASLASKFVSQHAYDEVLILRKGVPFLDDEVPHEMDHDGSTARDLCDLYGDDLMLRREADVGTIVKALDFGNGCLMDFPVVDNGRCVGLTTRSRLEAAITALQRDSIQKHEPTSSVSTDELLRNHSKFTELHEEDHSLGIVSFVSRVIGSPAKLGSADKLGESSTTSEHMERIGRPHLDRCIVPVHRIMDRSPYTILEDMPAPRFYPLFVKAGVNAAAVISQSGEFIGVMKRANLISQSRDDYLPPARQRKTMRRLTRKASSISSTPSENYQSATSNSSLPSFPQTPSSIPLSRSSERSDSSYLCLSQSSVSVRPQTTGSPHASPRLSLPVGSPRLIAVAASCPLGPIASSSENLELSMEHASSCPPRVEPSLSSTLKSGDY